MMDIWCGLHISEDETMQATGVVEKASVKVISNLNNPRVTWRIPLIKQQPGI